MSAAKLESHADPQKSPYFYLSYARADDESSVHEFFTDLSSLIRSKAKLTPTEVAGRWNTSRRERDEALRTSRVMIALLSPAYLKDEAALFEWKIFELRRQRALSTSQLTNLETLERSIIPICWSPCFGSLPVEISQTPLFDGDLKSGSNVAGGVKSLAKNQYSAFVKSLAHHIIQVTSSFQLPPLEAIPDEVSNAFETVDKPTTNSQTITDMPNKPTNQNINHNFVVIDGAFLESVGERIKGTKKRSPSENDLPTQPTEEEEYSVFVVDDDKNLLESIEATCDYSPSPRFKCEVFEDPVNLLSRVADAGLQASPDLFVVDLELTGKKMQGLELIENLALTLDVPSAIIAISENLNGGTLLNIAGMSGAVTGMSKPFTEDELLEKMARLAWIGKNRRLSRIDPTSIDESRNERPVFLSYSSDNFRTARFITNSFEVEYIDVFYAGYSIGPGDSPPAKIRASLKKAQIFVPLISESFVKSPNCRAELANALKQEADPNRRLPLKIIPILYDYSPDIAKKDDLIAKCLKENRELIMTPDKPVDTFQILLMRVQQFLRL